LRRGMFLTKPAISARSDSCLKGFPVEKGAGCYGPSR
jgi:hypothetical protein